MFGKHHFGFRHRPEDLFNACNKEGRAKRGDIKFFILEVLEEKPSHGYEIIRTLEERNKGMYKPSPGSVYPTLQMLEEGGFINGEQIEGKKVYTITNTGKDLLKERGDRPIERPQAGPQTTDIRTSSFKLAEAVKQGVKVGDDEAVKQICQILDNARKEIYLLLSDL